MPADPLPVTRWVPALREAGLRRVRRLGRGRLVSRWLVVSESGTPAELRLVAGPPPRGDAAELLTGCPGDRIRAWLSLPRGAGLLLPARDLGPLPARLGAAEAAGVICAVARLARIAEERALCPGELAPARLLLGPGGAALLDPAQAHPQGPGCRPVRLDGALPRLRDPAAAAALRRALARAAHPALGPAGAAERAERLAYELTRVITPQTHTAPSPEG